MNKKIIFSIVAIIIVGLGIYLMQNPVDKEMLNMCGGAVVEITEVNAPEKIESACDNAEIKITLTNLGDKTITQEDFENKDYYFTFCKEDMCIESYQWYDVKLENPIEPKQESTVILVKKDNQTNGFEALANTNGPVTVSFVKKTGEDSITQCDLEDATINIEIAPDAGSTEEINKCVKLD